MNEISQDIREYAHYYRSLYFKDMEKNVLALESALNNNGFTVEWAHNPESLAEHIHNLLPQKSYNKVCVDVQNRQNIFPPQENLNECQISSLVNREFNVDALIVDADFAVVSDGSLVFVDKQTQSCFNFANNIIVIVNLDQVILHHSELPVFLHIKNNNNSDFPQDVKIIRSNLTQIIPDPFISTDTKGYNTLNINVSVILYANTTNMDPLLEDDFLVSSVFCIHCNRCQEVCPVAKTTNLSPIDIVKKNCLDEYNRTQNIFKQTTLCGMCQEVCPVNIPLTDLLSYEMNIVDSNFTNWKSNYLFKIFSKRSKLNKTSNFFLYKLFMKLMFGKNKQLQNYFNRNKSTYFAIKEEENSTEPEENNAII
ncbi:MAG: 4Fe-4S dicluster domain-containing protein [Bacteroidales bacterium]|nr:4Fe-4S dicluster domain-containing protein [Bacteroidales bacterium]